MKWNEIESYAKDWVKEAGESIKASFQKKLTVQTKSNENDLVTNMDKETEQFFIGKIRNTFPEHRIMGEEEEHDQLTDLKGVIWIIDPIDGTMNFIHQQRNFAISIGIYENGIGKIGLIYDVVHDELYCGIKGRGAYVNETKLPKLNGVAVKKAIVGVNATWVTENDKIDPAILGRLVKDVRGTRSYGSAAIEMAYVATGRVDAYISLRLAPWDYAAGAIIVEELGGVITKLTGAPINLLEKSSILVAKPDLHKEIIDHYVTNFKEQTK